MRRDFSRVNIKPLGLVLLAFCVGISWTGCASKTKTHVPSKVVTVGNNTYSITRSAGNGFNRDTDALRAEAQDEAAQYCAAQGKQLKVISLTSNRPMMAMGYASATIVFKALAANDPELTAPASASVGGSDRTPTGDLYSELMKLDELHKKGILTDEEFQSEKTKVLNRSK